MTAGGRSRCSSQLHHGTVDSVRLAPVLIGNSFGGIDDFQGGHVCDGGNLPNRFAMRHSSGDRGTKPELCTVLFDAGTFQHRRCFCYCQDIVVDHLCTPVQLCRSRQPAAPKAYNQRLRRTPLQQEVYLDRPVCLGSLLESFHALSKSSLLKAPHPFPPRAATDSAARAHRAAKDEASGHRKYQDSRRTAATGTAAPFLYRLR